jgi:hypothetical protein
MLVCFASIVHIIWGVLLLVNGGALHITATSTLYEMVGAGHYEFRAWLYIVAGALPIVLVVRPRWSLAGLVACFPQLTLLALSGVSALTAITSGVYPDGTARSWPFIAMDQIVYVVLPILYAFETLDRFHDQSAPEHSGLTRNVVLSAVKGDVKIDARVRVGERGEKGDKGEKGDRGEKGERGEKGS